MRQFRSLTLAIATIALAACSPVNERTSVNIGYYDVAGTSFRELDRQFALHGPIVPGVGKAIASTSVRMVPDIRIDRSGGDCAVQSAKIKVLANVTLPRLTGRAAAAEELQGAFDNIERYARLHEAVHVAIADSYAETAEERIKAIPAQQSCAMLQDAVRTTFNATMEEHEAAQRQFDEDERERLTALASSGSQVRPRPQS